MWYSVCLGWFVALVCLRVDCVILVFVFKVCFLDMVGCCLG